MGSGLAVQKRRLCLNRIVNEIIPARYAYRYDYRRTETLTIKIVRILIKLFLLALT